MEEVKACIICGSNRKTTICEAKDRLHHIDGDFRVVQCGECGLVYLSPRPTFEEMDRYYPQTYEPHIDISAPRTLFRRLDMQFGLKKKTDALSRRKSIGRVLDIGCGTGAFLSAMKELGWEVYGVEISSHAAELARCRGLNVFCGEVSKASFPDEYFDVITLWDVLEHLHQPLLGLVEINRVLRKDGLLVVSTPDVDGPESRFFGKYWHGLDPPRHLYVFSPNTLTNLLNLTGFRVSEMKYFTGGYKVVILSLNHMVDDLFQNKWVRNIYRVIVHPQLVRAAMLPCFILMNRLRRGSVMTVFAEKVR